MFPDSPAWQLIFEALKLSPDIANLEHPDENELLALCRDHGILLVINQVLNNSQHNLFSESGQNQWRSEVAAYTLLGLTMHRELQRLLSRFAIADVSVEPFKGSVLSERFYGDPAMRMFTDIDLLVPPKDVRNVVDMLIDDGYLHMFELEALSGWLRPGSQVNHCVLKHPSGSWLVEVHWQLFAAWRRIPDPIVTMGTDGGDILEMLLYLCFHGAAHWWIRLKWVVDINYCVKSAQDLDWDELFNRAHKRGCVRVVRVGLLLAQVTCGLKLPENVSVEITSDPKVILLAKRVACFWLHPTTEQPSLLWKFCYLLACRERFSDKLGMILDYPLKRSFS